MFWRWLDKLHYAATTVQKTATAVAATTIIVISIYDYAKDRKRHSELGSKARIKE